MLARAIGVDTVANILCVADTYHAGPSRRQPSPSWHSASSCAFSLFSRAYLSEPSGFPSRAFFLAAISYSSLSLSVCVLTLPSLARQFFEIVQTDAFKELCLKSPALVNEVHECFAAHHEAAANRAADRAKAARFPRAERDKKPRSDA